MIGNLAAREERPGPTEEADASAQEEDAVADYDAAPLAQPEGPDEPTPA